MEVESQSLPAFDPPSKSPFSFSYTECASSDHSISSNGDVDSFLSSPNGLSVASDNELNLKTTNNVLQYVISSLPGQKGGNSESTAALKVQKVYRSYRTRRRLADSAVVAEELWWQVIDSVRLNHSTISFFNFAKESAASRWQRISLNASKVGKGLSKDVKALKLAFQHWIEAIDPRHRYGHSLHFYYEEWSKIDSGQPFFYWLDIGDGRDVDLPECPRSKLRQQSIKYLGPKERKHYEYKVIDGKIEHKRTGEFLHTLNGQTVGTAEGKWIFVMSTSKKLYVGKKKKGKFHHSSFLAGGATLAAGRLVAENGVLKSISAYSGHYRPTDDNLNSLLNFLKENGVNFKEVQVHRAEDTDNYKDAILVKEGSARPPPLEILNEGLLQQSFDATEVGRNEATEEDQSTTPSGYQRTLSGGLQSPKPDVPKTAILQRLNSKKAGSSYQLGHQLSRKWSTGAGPRIGCIADYPMELRAHALEFVNLSPRIPSTPTSFRQSGLLPPTPRPTSDMCNGVVNSIA